MSTNTTTSKAILFSIVISLIVSSIIVLAFIISGHFRPVDVKTDAFIGTMSTFVGIIVTLAIGFQIYNAIELKKEIYEAKRDTDNTLKQFEDSIKKIENLNTVINKLKYQLDEEKKRSSYLSIKQNVYFKYLNGQYNLSLHDSTKALDLYLIDMSLDDKYDIIGLIASILIKCYETSTPKDNFNFHQSLSMKTTQDEDIKKLCNELDEYETYINLVMGKNIVLELQKKYIDQVENRFTSELLNFRTGCPF